MDVKKLLIDMGNSAKFKGITFSGGVGLASDKTLDVTINVQVGGNIDLPGESEATIMAVLNNFGMGNFSKTIATSV